MVSPVLPILLRLASALRTCPCRMLWMSLWVWNKTEPGESSSPRDVGALPFVILSYVNEIFPPCPFTGLCVSCLYATQLICWKREAVFFDLLISLNHQTLVPPFHFIHEEMGVQKGFHLRFSSPCASVKFHFTVSATTWQFCRWLPLLGFHSPPPFWPSYSRSLLTGHL